MLFSVEALPAISAEDHTCSNKLRHKNNLTFRKMTAGCGVKIVTKLVLFGLTTSTHCFTLSEFEVGRVGGTQDLTEQGFQPVKVPGLGELVQHRLMCSTAYMLQSEDTAAPYIDCGKFEPPLASCPILRRLLVWCSPGPHATRTCLTIQLSSPQFHDPCVVQFISALYLVLWGPECEI
jgi:hypothetical protein